MCAPAYVYVHYICTGDLRGYEGIRYLGTGVIGGFEEPVVGAKTWTPSFTRRLTTESYLQPF